MAIPLDIRPPSFSSVLPQGSPATVESLCRDAGLACRVTGFPARRKIRVGRSSSSSPSAIVAPGELGEVWVGVPDGPPGKRALLVLGVLAYAVFDYAARESLRGLPESRPEIPRGRPRTGRALTGAERQRRHARKRGAGGP